MTGGNIAISRVLGISAASHIRSTSLRNLVLPVDLPQVLVGSAAASRAGDLVVVASRAAGLVEAAEGDGKKSTRAGRAESSS